MAARAQVAGILVVNAHLVQDTTGEGFAVRLFRKGNQRGFVRALSDQPCSFVSGFNKVYRPWLLRKSFILDLQSSALNQFAC